MLKFKKDHIFNSLCTINTLAYFEFWQAKFRHFKRGLLIHKGLTVDPKHADIIYCPYFATYTYYVCCMIYYIGKQLSF